MEIQDRDDRVPNVLLSTEDYQEASFIVQSNSLARTRKSALQIFLPRQHPSVPVDFPDDIPELDHLGLLVSRLRSRFTLRCF